MTRRELIKSLIGAVITSVLGVKWLVSKSVRKIAFASRSPEYPGTLVPMGDISGQGKWNG